MPKAIRPKKTKSALPLFGRKPPTVTTATKTDKVDRSIAAVTEVLAPEIPPLVDAKPRNKLVVTAEHVQATSFGGIPDDGRLSIFHYERLLRP